MIKKYSYKIEGVHVSGRKFYKDILVFAKEEEEAFDELRACLDYWEEVKSWKALRPPEIDEEPYSRFTKNKYEESGAFSVYDLNFRFEN